MTNEVRKRLGAVLAAGVIAAAGMLTGVATGATAVISDTDLKGAGAIWDLENDYDYGGGGPCYAVDGFQVRDGEVSGYEDVFDGGLLLVVDGATFNDSNGEGSLTMGGQQMTAGPETMMKGKLQVTRVERAFTDSPTLRSLVAFKNPKNKKVTATVLWDSAMGADAAARVRASQNGDLHFTAKDQWIVASDDGNTPSDGVLTEVFYGPGAPVRMQKALNDPGKPPVGPKTDPAACITARFKITVPAKSTKYLVFFTELHIENEIAVAQALRFTKIKPTSSLFAGLSKQVRKNVLNFKLT